MQEPFNLRNYQDEDTKGVVETIQGQLDGSSNILLCWGTGLGKTLGAGVIISEVFHLFTHVIVTTPSDNINAQFLGTLGLEETCKPKSLPRLYKRIGKDELKQLVPLYAPKDSTDLFRHLSNNKPVVITHALLWQERVRVYLDDLTSKESGNRLLILFDEAHHATASQDIENNQTRHNKGTACGELLEKLILKGTTTVVKMTATPYRADGQEVYKGLHRFERPLPLMMVEGFSVPKLSTDIRESEFLSLDGVGDKGILEGTTNIKKENVKALAKQVSEIWGSKGKIPAVIRFRSVDAEVNQSLLEALKEEFHNSYGFEPLDVVGEGGDKRLENEIKREKGLPYSEINPVIIAIHRATEGMDSPVRGLGICIGMPRSKPLLNQLIGRFMRLRVKIKVDPDNGGVLDEYQPPLYEGYPESHLERSEMVFIIEKREESKYKVELALALATLRGYVEASELHSALKSSKHLTLLNHKGTPYKRLKDFCDNKEVEHASTLLRYALNWWDTYRREPLDQPIRDNVEAIISLARCYESRSLKYAQLFDGSNPYISKQALVLAITKATLARPLSLDPKEKEARLSLWSAPDTDLEELLGPILKKYPISPGTLDGFGIEDMSDEIIKAIRPEDRLTIESLDKGTQYLQSYRARNEGRFPRDLNVRLVNNNPTTFRVFHNYIQKAYPDKYPGGFPQYVIESYGYQKTWKQRLSDLHKERIELLGTRNGDLWLSSFLDDPVKVYLGAWVGAQTPNDLDLAAACKMTPNEYARQKLSKT